MDNTLELTLLLGVQVSQSWGCESRRTGWTDGWKDGHTHTIRREGPGSEDQRTGELAPPLAVVCIGWTSQGSAGELAWVVWQEGSCRLTNPAATQVQNQGWVPAQHPPHLMLLQHVKGRNLQIQNCRSPWQGTTTGYPRVPVRVHYQYCGRSQSLEPEPMTQSNEHLTYKWRWID